MDDERTDDGWPTPFAKFVAFGLIVLAGASGGLIGWAVVDLQCDGACTAPNGLGALIGAVIAAGGVGIVTVLALQALAEWRAQEGRRRATRGQ